MGLITKSLSIYTISSYDHAFTCGSSIMLLAFQRSQGKIVGPSRRRSYI